MWRDVQQISWFGCFKCTWVAVGLFLSCFCFNRGKEVCFHALSTVHLAIFILTSIFIIIVDCRRMQDVINYHSIHKFLWLYSRYCIPVLLPVCLYCGWVAQGIKLMNLIPNLVTCGFSFLGILVQELGLDLGVRGELFSPSRLVRTIMPMVILIHHLDGVSMLMVSALTHQI